MKQTQIKRQKRRQKPGGDGEPDPIAQHVDTPAADRARHTLKKIDDAIGNK